MDVAVALMQQGRCMRAAKDLCYFCSLKSQRSSTHCHFKISKQNVIVIFSKNIKKALQIGVLFFIYQRKDTLKFTYRTF